MADEITAVTVNGTSIEVFMSYGLLNELARKLGGLEDLPALDLNNELRDDFLTAMLAERTKAGKITNPRDLSDVEISLADVEALLDWAKEHLAGFFLRRVESAKRHGDRIKAGLGPSSSAGTAA